MCFSRVADIEKSWHRVKVEKTMNFLAKPSVQKVGMENQGSLGGKLLGSVSQVHSCWVEHLFMRGPSGATGIALQLTQQRWKRSWPWGLAQRKRIQTFLWCSCVVSPQVFYIFLRCVRIPKTNLSNIALLSQSEGSSFHVWCHSNSFFNVLWH